MGTDLRTAAQQALEALETSEPKHGYACKCQGSRHWPHCFWQRHQDTIEALRAALEQPEQTNPWRDAVDDELVSLHMVASDDPRESIRRLIDWHCAVQIDPLVSSAAQELIERGKREALEQPEQEPHWLTKELMADYIDMVAEAIDNNSGQMLRDKAYWLLRRSGA